ncbi:hypothetical protein BD779DRAFT_1732944 [Infundibulicybe gibba]|nr:hypothetical protein BD779DRAFT_1732944 [Infundibulicybe gibba]
MAPISYTGALHPKKKSELQDIARALRLVDNGTKEELHNRIRKHLDKNAATLEENPTFAGLYGRRKRSVQPQPAPPMFVYSPFQFASISGRFSIGSPERTIVGRRAAAMETVQETTPISDLRDVSKFLKNPPLSPPDNDDVTTPEQSPRPHGVITPSSLPPLPHTPSRAGSVMGPAAEELISAQEVIMKGGNEMLISVRLFLSNSRNIWSLSVICELLYILLTAIPWKFLRVYPTILHADRTFLSFPYPPLSVFTTSPIWLCILHWSLPSLFFPILVGHLVSFSPTSPPSAPSGGSSSPLDPLTASIARLAAHLAYPYASLDTSSHVHGLDVLGPRWRVLSAGVGLAFAFAEAITHAPALFARSIGAHPTSPSPTVDDSASVSARPGAPRNRRPLALKAEETIMLVEE